MLKFDEKKKVESVRGALALRPAIEKVVDEILEVGFDRIYFVGIGGTWASSLQVETYLKANSKLPVFSSNAAEYLTTGDKNLTEKTVMIFSSVTGSTVEMVEAVKKVKAVGARVFAFIDNQKAELAKLCDYVISYPENEQLKFFMVANYLMHKSGEFPEYERYNQEMEAHLPQALVEVEKSADAFAAQFAKEKYEYLKAHPDMPHYFIGSGTQWGATYSYAMCYWEEQMWVRSKSIHSAEFFHGMLEIIEAETPVTLFLNEDEQRPLGERVARFLPQVCKNYTIIDSKDYPLEGISPEFRGSISHLVVHAVNNRVDVHMERELRHPLQIRRYYRQWDY